MKEISKGIFYLTEEEGKALMGAKGGMWHTGASGYIPPNADLPQEFLDAESKAMKESGFHKDDK